MIPIFTNSPDLKFAAKYCGLTEGLHLLECGTGPRLEAKGLGYARLDKLTLIDPCLEYLEFWKSELEALPLELECHNYAVTLESRTATLCVNPRLNSKPKVLTGNSFLKGGPAPPLERFKRRFRRTNNWPTREVHCCPLYSLNISPVDIAVIDVEGSELAVLQTLMQTPKLVMIELCYNNQHRSECFQWFRDNGYQKLGRNGSDFYFIR